MENNHKGFSVIELLTVVVLMVLIAGVASINIGAAQQSPKREAEKIAANFVNLAKKADRMKADFTAALSGDKFSVTWKDKGGNTIGSDDFHIDPDFTYIPHLDDTSIGNKTVTEWNYTSGSHIHILAAGSLSGSYSTANGTISYNFNKKGHRYIEVKSAKSSPYYIIITAGDIAK